MELKINVYKDCTAEEPSKTYVIRRITFKAAKELGTLQAKINDAKDEEQIGLTIEMLKCLIPDFDETDFDGIDPVELRTFFAAAGAEINSVVAKASKN